MSSQNRSAFVLGCATGIGRAIALDLASKGWHLTLVDIDAQGGQQTANECSRLLQGKHLVRFVAADALDFAAMARAFEGHMQTFKDLDLAVLNAGIGEGRPLIEAEGPEQWRKTLDLDLTAMIEATR